MKKCVKVKYADEQTARAAIERIKKVSTRKKVPENVYFCKECQAWHLTSQINREQLRAELFTLRFETDQKTKLIDQLQDKIKQLTSKEIKDEYKEIRQKAKIDQRVIELQKGMDTLRERNKKLTQTNSELVAKIVELRNKVDKYETKENIRDLPSEELPVEPS